jgi:hypothetical protein
MGAVHVYAWAVFPFQPANKTLHPNVYFKNTI